MATRVNKAAEKKYSETTERSGRITKHPVLKGVGVFCLCAVAAAAGTYFGIKYNHTDTVAQNMQDDTHYVQDDNSDRYENPSTGNGDANSADDAVIRFVSYQIPYIILAVSLFQYNFYDMILHF